MHAGISTANAVNPIIDVINQPQVVIGNRHRLMPLVRMSSVVVMKFNDPSNCPTQKIPIDVAHNTTPVPSPGPPTAPTALSGAYCVHPPSVGPSPTKNDALRTTNPVHVTQNDIMLKRGNGIS